MQRELPFYRVGDDYGWDQDKFPGFLMKHGGCAAVNACDSCIYFDSYMGLEGLYPYDHQTITREDYLQFAGQMKPYLHPRCMGIDTLELYMEGLGGYLSDQGCLSLRMHPFYGDHSAEEAKEAVAGQINRNIPVPILLLKHRNKAYDDFEWHWFMINGYRTGSHLSEVQVRPETPASGDHFQVKAVSYGDWVWFDLDDLWNTGYDRKGGLILFDL